MGPFGSCPITTISSRNTRIMSSHPPRIAIVGGGPSGLTIGLLLHKRGVPFTIFELRSRPSEEELSLPAGVLDLHKESGLSVIRELDLLPEFGFADR